jgi:VCBS repeat-containing protein
VADTLPLTVTAVNGSVANVGSTFILSSGASLNVQSDGTYAYNANGAFEFLNDGETATDSFTYTVSDGTGGTDTATVTITISGVTDLDFVVSGTTGDDVIDAAYVGDPEGDRVDNNDAADASNDDVIVAGEGNDTVTAGAGNDTVYGDSITLDPLAYVSAAGAATTLTVTNSADAPIELWWIDGSGSLVFYQTIQPGDTYVQPTFDTHNWVLRDPARQLTCS